MLENFRRLLHTKSFAKGGSHIPGTVFYSDKSGRVNPLESFMAQGFINSCTEAYREPIIEHTKAEVKEAAARKKKLIFKVAGESPKEQYLILQRIALFRWIASEDEKLELGGIKETWYKNGRLSVEVIIKYAKGKQKRSEEREGMSAYEKMVANFSEGELTFDADEPNQNIECVVECFPNITENSTQEIEIACKRKARALKRGVDVTTVFEPHGNKCCMIATEKRQKTMEGLTESLLDKTKREREDNHNINH